MFFITFNKLFGNIASLIWGEYRPNISRPITCNICNQEAINPRNRFNKAYIYQIRSNLLLTFKEWYKIHKCGIISFTFPWFHWHTVLWLKATLEAITTYIQNPWRISVKLWQVLQDQTYCALFTMIHLMWIYCFNLNTRPMKLEKNSW